MVRHKGIRPPEGEKSGATMNAVKGIAKGLVWVMVCVAPFLCASCLSMSLPKSAKVQSPTDASETASNHGPGPTVDKGLVDTWELLYQKNDEGMEQRPRESTRTLIEFTERGHVIFNSMDRDNSDKVKSRSGKYSVNGERINITDDVGNTVSWPYQLAGDTLVLVMPEEKKKFYWRRFR